MVHLQAISEEKASLQIQALYKDIRQTLHTPKVPLVFQYLANFEEYIVYLWEQLQMNVASRSFSSFEQEVADFALCAASNISLPANTISPFFQSLQALEQKHIKETIASLLHINSVLAILLIGIRESVKGVMIGTKLIAPYAIAKDDPQEVFDTEREVIPHTFSEGAKIQEVNTMLAPLFGAGALSVIQYPEFFAAVAELMEKVVTTEAYLSERVELERVILRTTKRFTHPLENSYQKLVTLAGSKPYFSEMLYLLSETFPSQFPRLILTTSIMNRVIQSQQTPVLFTE